MSHKPTKVPHLYNATLKGKLSCSSTRAEYEFYYWIIRTYNNNWRNVHMAGVLNIALNVHIENERQHGEMSVRAAANASYSMGKGYSSRYQGQNFCRLLGRDRKVAKELKLHRSIYLPRMEGFE
jgi:hypothetical protein